MGLKQIFEKQGGMKLLKQYWQSGAFFTAVGEFLLLGKSRTALEILRLSAGLKTKQKLEKKYRNVLLKLASEYEEKEHKTDHKIWICWLQGMENAPDIVQTCYKSVQKNIKDREIVLITQENYRNYVHFPDIIQSKIDRGIIKGAHMTDLLRLELLLNYGGTWIDATVFCSNSSVPDYMLDADLFMFQCMKPGRDGHSNVVSNWFITATTHNKILYLTRGLLYHYWEHNDDLVDYFIFHHFFQMVIELCPEEWNNVVPFSNSTPHILLLRLFETYDDTIWKAVTVQTPFHKLTYKFDENQIGKENTYYKKIIGNL